MKIEQLFAAWEELKVLVIGDVMIDRYINGQVNRISPEAPVPVVLYKSQEDRIGGAGNVALNIKALGATPILCSVIGDDQNGIKLQKLLSNNKMSSEGLIESKDRITTVKTRVMAQNQQLLRIDEEESHYLNQQEEDSLLKCVFDLIHNKQIDVILFQDYNKGVLSLPVIRAILLEAIKGDIPTAVDPKQKNFWAYKRITLFKPNLKEIRDQVDFPLQADLKSLSKAGNYIKSKLDNSYTLITLSEKGLFWTDHKNNNLTPTTPRSIADVSGAGDTVISIAALGLATPKHLDEIPFLANLAGGQVCEKAGVVPVNKEQLIAEYKAYQKSRPVTV